MSDSKKDGRRGGGHRNATGEGERFTIARLTTERDAALGYLRLAAERLGCGEASGGANLGERVLCAIDTARPTPEPSEAQYALVKIRETLHAYCGGVDKGSFISKWLDDIAAALPSSAAPSPAGSEPTEAMRGEAERLAEFKRLPLESPVVPELRCDSPGCTNAPEFCGRHASWPHWESPPVGTAEPDAWALEYHGEITFNIFPTLQAAEASKGFLDKEWPDASRKIIPLYRAPASGGGREVSETEPPPWNGRLLTEAEEAEAHDLFARLTRQGDPLALVRTIEHFRPWGGPYSLLPLGAASAPVVPREAEAAATYVEGSRERLAEIMATIKPQTCLHGVPNIRPEACDLCAASDESSPLNVLDFCEGAIHDAIWCEDGLDGAAGEAVLAMIRNARAYRAPSPAGSVREPSEAMVEAAWRLTVDELRVELATTRSRMQEISALAKPITQEERRAALAAQEGK